MFKQLKLADYFFVKITHYTDKMISAFKEMFNKYNGSIETFDLSTTGVESLQDTVKKSIQKSIASTQLRNNKKDC